VAELDCLARHADDAFHEHDVIPGEADGDDIETPGR